MTSGRWGTSSTPLQTDKKSVAYAENHDQAPMDDETIALRLTDKEMYEPSVSLVSCSTDCHRTGAHRPLQNRWSHPSLRQLFMHGGGLCTRKSIIKQHRTKKQGKLPQSQSTIRRGRFIDSASLRFVRLHLCMDNTLISIARKINTLLA